MIAKVTRALKEFIKPLSTGVSGSANSGLGQSPKKNEKSLNSSKNEEKKDEKKNQDSNPDLRFDNTSKEIIEGPKDGDPKEKQGSAPGLTLATNSQLSGGGSDEKSIPEQLIKMLNIFRGSGQTDNKAKGPTTYKKIIKIERKAGRFRKGTMFDDKAD